MTDHDLIDKKALSARDICTKFITPAIKEITGWSSAQFYEEFTLGRSMCGENEWHARFGIRMLIRIAYNAEHQTPIDS
jgi:hypothetical protein